MAPKKAAAASPTPGEQGGAPAPGDEAGGDDYDMPVIIKVKPEDQLQLSPVISHVISMCSVV